MGRVDSGADGRRACVLRSTAYAGCVELTYSGEVAVKCLLA